MFDTATGTDHSFLVLLACSVSVHATGFLQGYFHLRRRFLKNVLSVSGHARPLGIPSEVL